MESPLTLNLDVLKLYILKLLQFLIGEDLIFIFLRALAEHFN